MNIKNANGYLVKPRNLSTIICKTIFCFTLIAITFTTCCSTLIYYTSHEKQELDALSKLVSNMAITLNKKENTDEQVVILEKQLPSNIRFTLISQDGQVLSDTSIPDNTSIANHKNRPEISKAQQQGKATAERYSYTLNQDAIYAAIRLDNSNILRISELRESLFFFVSNLLFPFCIIFIATLIFALISSKIITRYIMEPMEKLDLSNPLDCICYEEMTPLLTRINEQQFQLKKQNESLERAVNSRKIFTDNVSHEMKTPLQVISGYAEIIKEGLTSFDEAKDFSNIIYNEAQIMRRLIDDLLTLSHLTTNRNIISSYSRFNLKELVQEIIYKMYPLATKEHIEIILEADSFNIDADKDLMRILFSNLISNAIRYNVENGKIEVSLNQNSQSITIQIKDSGIGIAKKDQEHIFERFYRTDKSRNKTTGGTGLGLAIVKHIVLIHHGTIQVRNNKPKGTIFIIDLPQTTKEYDQSMHQ